MSELTYTQAYREGVREEMSRDPSIIVLGTDLFIRGGHWAQVKGLGQEFGAHRVRDTPISEAAMVAAGVGAAAAGLRPIVDLNFLDFIFGAMDEVANQAAKMRYMWGASVPLVIRATTGVAFGAAQHNNQLEGWFSNLPGLLVAMPATPADVKGMIKSALRGADPVLFLMHKSLSGVRGEVDGPEGLVPLGRASVCREGTDLTIVCYSGMRSRSLLAAEALAAGGVSAEVVDLRSVAPIDLATVSRSVRKTGRVLVASEAPARSGIAAEVAAAIAEADFDYLDRPVMRVTAGHAPVPHSPVLIEALIPSAVDIEKAALRLLDEPD